MKKKVRSNLLNLIAILAVLGFIISCYLIYSHYNPDFTGIVCKPGEQHQQSACSVANTSEYSEFFGIPVALLGALWFVFLTYLALKNKKKKQFRRELLYFTTTGIFAVIYFIWAEVQLETICTYCTITHVIIVISFFLSLYLYKKA